MGNTVPCSIHSNQKDNCESIPKCNYFSGYLFGLLGDEKHSPNECYLNLDYLINNFDRLNKKEKKIIYQELLPNYISHNVIEPAIQNEQMELVINILKENKNIKAKTIKSIMNIINNVQLKYKDSTIPKKRLKELQQEAVDNWIRSNLVSLTDEPKLKQKPARSGIRGMKLLHIELIALATVGNISSARGMVIEEDESGELVIRSGLEGKSLERGIHMAMKPTRESAISKELLIDRKDDYDKIINKIKNEDIIEWPIFKQIEAIILNRFSEHKKLPEVQEYEKKINKKLAKSIKRYTGSEYKIMNKILRLRELSDFDSENFKKTIQNMYNIYNAIDNAPSFNKDNYFFRGIIEDNNAYGYKGSKVGDIVYEPGFISMSEEIKTALEFCGFCCMLIIRMPKGSKMLDISKFSIVSSEKEVIGLPGYKFKITKIAKINNMSKTKVLFLDYIGATYNTVDDLEQNLEWYNEFINQYDQMIKNNDINSAKIESILLQTAQTSLDIVESNIHSPHHRGEGCMRGRGRKGWGDNIVLPMINYLLVKINLLKEWYFINLKL